MPPMNDTNSADASEVEVINCEYCETELDSYGLCEECDAECDGMSDYAERMSERRAMGLCNF